MAAGLSQKQIYNRIYNRLQRIKGELRQQGYFVEYKDRALVNRGGTDVVWFSVGHASNGETCALLINNTGVNLK